MKSKIFLLSCMLLVSIFSFGQNTGLVKQSLGGNPGAKSMVLGAVGGDSGIITVKIIDTTTANKGPRLKFTDNLLIRAGDSLAIRDTLKHRWILFSPVNTVGKNFRDGFISGDVSLLDSTVTIANGIWRRNDTVYSQTGTFSQGITRAAIGYYRNDVIWIDSGNIFHYTIGVQDTVNALLPSIDYNGIQVTVVHNFGATIQQPVAPTPSNTFWDTKGNNIPISPGYLGTTNSARINFIAGGATRGTLFPNGNWSIGDSLSHTALLNVIGTSVFQGQPSGPQSLYIAKYVSASLDTISMLIGSGLYGNWYLPQDLTSYNGNLGMNFNAKGIVPGTSIQEQHKDGNGYFAPGGTSKRYFGIVTNFTNIANITANGTSFYIDASSANANALQSNNLIAQSIEGVVNFTAGNTGNSWVGLRVLPTLTATVNTTVDDIKTYFGNVKIGMLGGNVMIGNDTTSSHKLTVLATNSNILKLNPSGLWTVGSGSDSLLAIQGNGNVVKVAQFTGGGGSGLNFYNSDSTLLGNRTVDGGGHNLLFNNVQSFIVNSSTSDIQLNSGTTLALSGVFGVSMTDGFSGSFGLDGASNIVATGVYNYTHTGFGDYTINLNSGAFNLNIDGPINIHGDPGSPGYVLTSHGGGGGDWATWEPVSGGSNFANTDLTATGGRFHDFDGHFLQISNISNLTLESIYYTNNNRSFNLVSDSSFLISAGTSTGEITAGTSLTFGSGSSDPILFTAGGSEKMRIDPNGNVGIGTTTPSYPLDVNGTGNFSDGVIIQAGANLLLSGQALGSGEAQIRMADDDVDGFLKIIKRGGSISANYNLNLPATGNAIDTFATLYDVRQIARPDSVLADSMTGQRFNASTHVLYNDTLPAHYYAVVNQGQLSRALATTGSGTVTSVATGYGLSGGTITTSGTLLVDSATLSSKYLRRADSILNVGWTTLYEHNKAKDSLQTNINLKANIASPTFTGTVTIPTPFTLGATSVTSTGTQLNYLNAATGTTGTTSTNVVFSTSPTLVTPTLGVATATSINKLTITAPTTSSTLTVVDGSSLITSGAFALTLTSTATSNATIPAGTNTLYSTLSGSITSAQLATSLTNETGTAGGVMFSVSPTSTGLLTTDTITPLRIRFANTAGAIPQATSSINFDANSTATTNGLSWGTTLGIYRNGTSQLTTSAGLMNFSGSITIANTSQIYWLTRTALQSAADGRINITNNAGTSFTRFTLGNETSSFPALTRSSADLCITDGSGGTASSFGVGNTSVAASAIAEFTSTTKGFLPPRWTNTQMAAISSPATGLLGYNTDAGATYVYNGTSFKSSGVISGSFSQVGTATTVFTVTFGGTQPNSTYKVNVTPTAALSAALFYVTNKTTTTFDVTYLSGLTGTVTFDYSLYQ